MTGSPKLEPTVPRWKRAASAVRAYVTWWPWEVRRLKAAGYRRVGWMTWESGPDS